MSRYRGYMLIELLIVLAIIGALLALVVPRMMNQGARARDIGRKGALYQASSVFLQYYHDHGSYPVTGGCIDTTLGRYSDYAGFPPVDPVADWMTLGCEESYRYVVLEKNDQEQGAVLLLAKVALPSMGNFDLASVPTTYAAAEQLFCSDGMRPCTTFSGVAYYAILP